MNLYEIAPNLWQSGSLTDSLSIVRDPGVDVIVDLEGNVDLPVSTYSAPPGSILYVWWPIEDGPMPNPELVRELARSLSVLLTLKHRILVHCAAGLNRSGLIVARTLIEQGTSASEAIRIVREKRGPEALSNREFVTWLLTEPSR